ncbi:hypothetical protein ABPG72_009648 [Tetrahymena utriculariae]
MRLLSHNLLQCNVKNCKSNNFPLKIQVDKSNIINCEFRKEPLVKLIPKLDWSALAITVHNLAKNKDFPEKYNPALLDDLKFMQDLHRILMETHIIEGALICEGCNKRYPIKNGIPNMILNDEEV